MRHIEFFPEGTVGVLEISTFFFFFFCQTKEEGKNKSMKIQHIHLQNNKGGCLNCKEFWQWHPSGVLCKWHFFLSATKPWVSKIAVCSTALQKQSEKPLILEKWKNVVFLLRIIEHIIWYIHSIRPDLLIGLSVIELPNRNIVFIDNGLSSFHVDTFHKIRWWSDG